MAKDIEDRYTMITMIMMIWIRIMIIIQDIIEQENLYKI